MPSEQPRKRKSPRKWRIILIVVIGFAALWPLLASLAAQFLIVKKDLAAADAIVVLSGSSTYLERTNRAAQLYREGRAPMVIVTDEKLMSSWSQTEERNPFFYELAVRELERQGVPSQNIRVVSDIGAGTFQECSRIRDFATAHRINRLLLVTSAYHTQRALWSMQRASAGSNLQIGIDGSPPGWLTPSPAKWWLSRWGWKVVAGEYVKLIYYRLRY
ncbi:MAG TPA: YdcF family protein [Pyrinomonadaceae bacterium]|nr:YdcF family protein [Pyrinomonadaceae bacterium]